MKANFDPIFIIEIFPRIFKYTYITISITLISMIIGLCIGIVLALIRVYKIKGFHLFSRIYISFFRGTPLIVQLFLLYYGMPQIIPSLAGMSAFTAACIGLSLNSAAYMAEVIRGAINAIDKGQMEACFSTGMTSWQGMRRVVLPQAARVAIPALGNTFVSLLKETSLAFTLGVAEILAQSKMIAAANYRFFESYLTVALIFWGITVCISYLQSKLEYKLNSTY